MKAAATAMFGLILIQTVALADTLKLRSGEKVEGRILAESKRRILFQELDGTIREVPATDVSIIDRSDVSKMGGSVIVFTVPPKKEKKSLSDAQYGQDAQKTPSDNMNKLLKSWVEKHPESKEWLLNTAADGVLKSVDMKEVLAEIDSQS